jgi:hypothetical protein
MVSFKHPHLRWHRHRRSCCFCSSCSLVPASKQRAAGHTSEVEVMIADSSLVSSLDIVKFAMTGRLEVLEPS